MSARQPNHSIQSSTVADLLERVLDKGVVIAGDVRIKLVDIELLSIQIRLVICSVDKAKEMGMDWWANSPVFGSAPKAESIEAKPPMVDTVAAETVEELRKRVSELESALARPVLPEAGRIAPKQPIELPRSDVA
ncbi:MAG: gas vesicle protein [Planctomycetota bacterium]|nr:gas vesicle protein [Planctomycetota bacterium]